MKEEKGGKAKKGREAGPVRFVEFLIGLGRKIHTGRREKKGHLLRTENLKGSKSKAVLEK